jgi:peptidoglycan/LPS O-acetylase OafA/YrhL
LNAIMSEGANGYRSDIDGLRAVAVASVVFYHAGVPFLPGGFVGVDVFFVISGYLITRIIAREIAEGRFSILTFYERRTRRIFPALFAMLGACVLVAALIQLPGEFAEFGQSLAAATLFVSNVFFWQTADYFGGPAHLKPLLHTWSLAVEEQFYIVFPLLLLAIARWGQRRWLVWLVPLTLASLALSVWAASAKPNAAFYLLPFRFWELSVGALLALGIVPAVKGQFARASAGVLGLGMIAGSVIFFSSAMTFPGLAALLPCLGAALVIHAGTGTGPQTPVSRLLSLRPVVFVGLISYSLYLWHWPVLVFARLWRGEVLPAQEAALFVALSVGLAVLSWRYVEAPFRRGRVAETRRPLFRAATVAMASMLAVAVVTDRSGGWPQRLDGYAPPQIAGLQEMGLATCFLEDDQPPESWAGPTVCGGGGARKPKVLIWGDSFAAHLVPGLRQEAGGVADVIQYTAGGCPPLLGVTFANRPHCRRFNDRALELIGELRPDVVLVSARWDLYLPRAARQNDVVETVARLERLGARVVVVAESPTFDFSNPYDFEFRQGRSDVARAAERSPSLATVLSGIGGVQVFEPMSLFCSQDRCRLKDEDAFLFFDGGHYSVDGSRLVARSLVPYLSRVLAGQDLRTSHAMDTVLD